MSSVNGTAEPMTYGEAVVELGKIASWGNQGLGNEVLLALQTEHGLVPPAPTPNYADPRDESLVSQAARIAALELEKAQREAADARSLASEQAARIASLEAEAAAARDRTYDPPVTLVPGDQLTK